MIIRALLSWIPNMRSGKISLFLEKITEPLLNPIRNFLLKHIPQKWLRIDISPIVLWLLLDICSILISSLFGGLI